ncbi:MAG TPA: TetR/AcrR family transcriptional regulator [Candidatus Saccharimonadales bacterium]|nr:TetR/AcrR family transcriptional regulator [Candidatus Saccharimonadales bacterium]
MLQEQCDRLDPRIRRTRQLLQDALRKLLEQKGFDDITVQDITEAATLNRATFYAHYPDKFALLEELIRVSFLQLLAQRNVSFDGTCPAAFRAIILALCDYLLEIQKLQSSDRLQFEPFVEATVIDQIRLMLMEGFRRNPQQRRISAEMIAATASWTIYGSVKQWVSTADRCPAEDFVSVALELVTPVLSAGLQPVASQA